MRRITVASAVLLLLAACSGPEGYAIAPQEAFDRLIKSELEAMVETRSCGIDVDVTAEPDPDPARRAVIWYLSSGGEEMLRLTATLTEVSPGRTKVAVAAWNEAHGAGAYDGARFYPRPILNQPILPPFTEQVAALLEARPYDLGRALSREDGQIGPSNAQSDRVCSIQRAGREKGIRFATDDRAGQDSVGSEAIRRAEAAERVATQGRFRPGEPDPRAGQPMLDPRP